MKRLTTKKLLLFTALIFSVIIFSGVSSYSAKKDKVKFTASVNRNKIGINETLQYTLSIKGVGGRINLPEPPQFKNFDILNSRREQRQSIINGRMSASFNMIFKLLPKKSGKFTIKPGTFNHGKVYKSNTVVVEVIQGEKKPKQQAPQSLSPSIDPQARDRGVHDNLFFKASINKSTAVVNEPILLTLGFYKRINLYDGKLDFPSLSGFWVEDLEESHDIRETIVEGRTYIVEEWKKILFPTTTGTFTIGEAKIMAKTSPFQAPYEIKTNPRTITIVDFPEDGKPDDFSGAVGRYKIKATLDSKESSVNEPITLLVKITGTGNVDSISDIKVNIPSDIDIYESVNSSNSYHAKNYVHGERIFEYTLISRGPGEYKIDPISLSYYDYRDKKYKTISTGAIQHRVTGGAADSGRQTIEINKNTVSILKREINHIKPVPDGKLYGNGLLYTNRNYLLAHLLPFLLLGLTILSKRKKNLFRKDVALARSTKARRFASKKLRKARSLMNEKTQKEFFSEISFALDNYFADKLNVSASSLVTEDLIQQLSERLGEKAPVEAIRECLASCDAARFSTTGLSLDEMKKSYSLALEIINTLERNWKRGA